MHLDNNPKSKEAFKIGSDGDQELAWKMEDEVIAEVHDAVEAGECFCSCPNTKCRLHGNCMDCVIVHRGHRDHLPFCMHDMVNERLDGLASLTESRVYHL